MSRSVPVVPLTARAATVLMVAAIVVGGCSSASASRAPSAVPSAVASASSAAGQSAAPSQTAAGGLKLPTPDRAPALKIAEVAGLGKVLADENGMVLYTDDQDPADSSACIEQCAETWLPWTIDAGTTVTTATGIDGHVASITRPDGTIQITYDGSPLYFYHLDPKPGVVKGAGVAPEWSVATP